MHVVGQARSVQVTFGVNNRNSCREPRARCHRTPEHCGNSMKHWHIHHPHNTQIAAPKSGEGGKTASSGQRFLQKRKEIEGEWVSQRSWWLLSSSRRSRVANIRCIIDTPTSSNGTTVAQQASRKGMSMSIPMHPLAKTLTKFKVHISLRSPRTHWRE